MSAVYHVTMAQNWLMMARVDARHRNLTAMKQSLGFAVNNLILALRAGSVV